MANKFSLTVLGAGVMIPTKERNPAGFLVDVGDKKVLVDAGHGTIRRLVDYGFNIQDIDLVFVSHFHTDHFSDVFPLIHSRWVDDNYNRRRNKPLTIIGPAGIEKRFKLWRKIFWPEPKEFYPVEFKEGMLKIKFGKALIETFPITHVKWFPSVGIRITYQDKKLVYTGDLGSRQDFNELVKNARNTNLLITEASYEKPTPNHYTVQQVKELTEEARIKKVLIVHIRPQHLKRVQEICRKNPRFILGKDGLKSEI